MSVAEVQVSMAEKCQWQIGTGVSGRKRYRCQWQRGTGVSGREVQVSVAERGTSVRAERGTGFSGRWVQVSVAKRDTSVRGRGVQVSVAECGTSVRGREWYRCWGFKVLMAIYIVLLHKISSELGSFTFNETTISPLFFFAFFKPSFNSFIF